MESILNIKIDTFKPLKNELKINFIGEKVKTVDSLSLINDKIYVHLEVNTEYYKEIEFRNYVYFSNVVARKTKRGESYSMDDNYIHISISYKLPKTRKVVTQKEILSNVKIIEYNMDKISKLWYFRDEKKIRDYKYLIMQNLNKEELEKLSEECKGDETIMRFKEKLTKLNESDQYDSLIDQVDEDRLWKNTFIKQGISRGMNQGLKIGRSEGIHQEKENLAKNMLKDGVNIAKIAKYTNLSEKYIASLR